MLRLPSCDELPYRSMMEADAVEHLRGASPAEGVPEAPETSRWSPPPPPPPLLPAMLMEPPRLGWEWLLRPPFLSPWVATMLEVEAGERVDERAAEEAEGGVRERAAL